MQVEPPFEGFAPAYERGEAQLLWTRLVSDLETPVSAFLKLAANRQNAFLLESVEGGATRGRYSMIGFDPDLLFRAQGSSAEMARLPDLQIFSQCQDDTLTALRLLIAESRIAVPPGLPPMAAGIFGYLAYDAVRLMERLPPPDRPGLEAPDVLLVRPRIVAIFDTVKDELTVVTPIRPEPRLSARAAYDRAVDRLIEVVDALDCPLTHAGAPADLALTGEVRSNTSPDEYRSMVARAKEYIAAGDIFQVVLSQRFEAPFPLPAISLYRALRRVNPSPFLYFLDFAGFSIVGSSPEILVRVREGEVTIRPIAGTRPAGDTPTRTSASAPSFSPIPRSAQSTSCCSTSAATMPAGSRNSAVSASPTSSSWNTTAT
jgi:anthranilate synthase component 1